MSARSWGFRANADSTLGVAMVGLLGCGAAIALAGAAAGTLPFALVGALVAGAALMVLLAAGWLPALTVLALSLPLPAPYSTERIRIAPAAMTTAAVLLAWLAGRAVDTRSIDLRALPRAPIVALLLALSVSTLSAVFPLIAVRELVNWLVLLGLLVVATDSLSVARWRVASLARVLATVAGISGAFAALQMVGVLPGRFELSGTPFHRADLGFGQPNGLAMFLALSLPLSMYACEEARGVAARVLAIAGLGACGLGLIATFSRGSWLAVLAAALVLLRTGQWRFVLRVWLVALAGALLVDVMSGGALSERIARTFQDAMVVQRMALTFAGLLMLRAHPVVGVGPGGFGEALERFGPQVAWLWEYVPSAHNGYVQMAAETGILGLAALVVFLGAVFRRLLRGAKRASADAKIPAGEASLRRALLWSFAIALLVGLAEWPFAHGVGQLIMLVAAMGIALEQTGAEVP